MYAEQNDRSKANTHFSLALQNASPQQVAGIAADYATFLTDWGDHRRAELMLRQALTQSPDDVELIRMLARCLIRQEKVTEGRRYLLSVGTVAEANAEIAMIYRDQGNIDMLVAVEQRWGSSPSGAIRPETTSPEATKPVLAMARPEAVQPEAVRSAPVHVTAAAPKPVTAPPLPGVVRTPQPPLPAAVAPRTNVPPQDVAVLIAATPSAATPSTATPSTASTVPVSRSEFFDSRVPIPVPNVTPLPAVIAANAPSPAPALQALPSATTQPERGRPVLTNPVRFASAPVPVTTPEAETKEPPKPAMTVQPRRHYVVNAGTSADLEALLPNVRPVAATVAR